MFESITVLGSGTLVPQKGRACAGYLLRRAGGPLLLDCGPGTFLRLRQAGVDVRELRLILLSHLHIDHVSDLEAVLNSRWLQSRPAEPVRAEPGRAEPSRTEPVRAEPVRTGPPARLPILGPQGFASWFARRLAGEEDWLATLGLELREMDEQPVELDGLRVQARRTLHTPNSLCYRLTDRAGVSLFYSGDMDFQEALLPFAAGADLGLLEASWTQGAGGPGHLSAAQAGQFAARAGLKRLLLTHFYQPVSRRAVRARVRRAFRGPLYLARDLLTLPLGR